MADNRQTTLGELFKNRREPGQADLPLMSVTMNNGLVDRESLDRKTDSELTSEGHLLVRAGDIAYNMMRMWQGASGMAQHDAIVSPAYVVLAPTTDIDPLFASYWFKSARMIYLFWAYSYGITGDRLRLYYKDFAQIPVTLPPKSLQTLIGKTLSAWDREIEHLGKLIDAQRRLKTGLAQQLLTGLHRFQGFQGRREVSKKNDLPSSWTMSLPDDWTWGFLKDVAQVNPTTLPETTDPSYRFRYIDLGMVKDGAVAFPEQTTEFRDSPSRARRVVSKHDILMATVRPNLQGFAYWNRDEADVVCSTGFAVIRVSKACPGFVYQWLFSRHVSQYFHRCIAGSNYPALNPNDVKKICIPQPSIGEQQQIASVLGGVDGEIALLERQMALLIKQKRGLMQRLFVEEMNVTK